MSDAPKIRIGDYELLDLLGEGGEGKVNKAVCVAQNNPRVAYGEIVAIKRMRAQGQDEKGAVLFQRQSEILRALSHPNILRYRDAFTWQGDELGGEVFCLVTEFLEGEDLTKLLKKNAGGLPWEQVQQIFGQTLAAMVYAQSLDVGIVHRDLKPSNIFITRDGTVKLLDFGIARRDDGAATNTASAAGLKGSFDYLAPDFVVMPEFRGDGQSDIFSLGICLYQMLTGKLPFLPPLSENPNAVIGYVSRWHAPQPPMVEFKHEAFKVLSHARSCITHSLSLQREQRFKSFAEFQEEFKRIGRIKVRHEAEAYEFLALLGRGGVGEVYKARRQSDGLEVAVKRLLDVKYAHRFVQEARMNQDASNPYIVKYIDFVEVIRHDEDSEYFLILEYLAGLPAAGLRSRIKASGSGLELKEALELFINYLLGLEQLHRKNIIHRDIKPGNLYAPAGHPERAKISDLGWVPDLEEIQKCGYILGRQDYKPPEYALPGTGRGSPQFDIYSVGISLYETLTRDLPLPKWPGNERDAWVQYLSHSGRPPAYRFTHPVFLRHPPLAEILNRAMAPDPCQRQVSALALSEELRAILENARREEAVPVSAVAARPPSQPRSGGESG